jgi:imidazolonepropionase-like amidohydrolase
MLPSCSIFPTKFGTVASGKSADLIGVDSSPLDKVSVLERVAFVMARGDVYRA